MKQTPTVGQTLYSLNVGDAARRSSQVLTPVTVTKVGRKYFTVGEGWASQEYHLSDWREKTDYTPTSCLYVSEQEFADQKESAELTDRIRHVFSYLGGVKHIPLESLRSIYGIIMENKETL